MQTPPQFGYFSFLSGLCIAWWGLFYLMCSNNGATYFYIGAAVAGTLLIEIGLFLLFG
jgi:hypothetical protein